MKNLKKLLMCIACVLTLAFAGVINYLPAGANKAFASQDTATEISTVQRLILQLNHFKHKQVGLLKIFFMRLVKNLNHFMAVRFIQQNLFMKK